MKIQIQFEIDWNKSKEEMKDIVKELLIQANMGILCNHLEKSIREQKLYSVSMTELKPVGRINYWRE